VTCTVPGARPVIVPDVIPIVAIDVLLTVHVPPVAGCDNVMPDPTHTCDAPEIAGKPTVTTTLR